MYLEIAYNDNFIMVKGSKNHLVIDRKGETHVVEGMPSNDCCKSGVKFMKLRFCSCKELTRIKNRVIYIDYFDEEVAFIKIGEYVTYDDDDDDNALIGAYKLYGNKFIH